MATIKEKIKKPKKPKSTKGRTEDLKQRACTPKKYSKHLVKIAEKLARYGLVDSEIADRLCITKKTFYDWSRKYLDFDEAVKFGKSDANLKVAEGLYNRAIGMKVTKQVAFKPKDEDVTIVNLIDELAPDPKSAIHWLALRDPEKWDKAHKIILEGKLETDILLYEIPGNKRGPVNNEDE